MLPLVFALGCAPEREPKPAKLTADRPAIVVENSATSPNTPAQDAVVYEPTLDDFILQLEPTDRQRAAIEQARVALETLIETNIVDEAELQVAITDVVEASACLRARFANAQPDVPQLISELALSSAANRIKADAAFHAFQRSPGRPLLAELEPQGNGCLDDFGEEPEPAPGVVALDAGKEEFLAANGDVIAEPQAQSDLAQQFPSQEDWPEDEAAMRAAEQDEAPVLDSNQLKPLESFTVQ